MLTHTMAGQLKQAIKDAEAKPKLKSKELHQIQSDIQRLQAELDKLQTQQVKQIKTECLSCWDSVPHGVYICDACRKGMSR